MKGVGYVSPSIGSHAGKCRLLINLLGVRTVDRAESNARMLLFCTVLPEGLHGVKVYPVGLADRGVVQLPTLEVQLQRKQRSCCIFLIQRNI